MRESERDNGAAPDWTAVLPHWTPWSSGDVCGLIKWPAAAADLPVRLRGFRSNASNSDAHKAAKS